MEVGTIIVLVLVAFVLYRLVQRKEPRNRPREGETRYGPAGREAQFATVQQRSIDSQSLHDTVENSWRSLVHGQTDEVRLVNIGPEYVKAIGARFGGDFEVYWRTEDADSAMLEAPFSYGMVVIRKRSRASAG